MYYNVYTFGLISGLFVILAVLIDKFVKSKEKPLIELENTSNLYLTNYHKKRYFFTKNENVFFKRLYHIINSIREDKYIIFSKVRVSDVISTDKEHPWSWKKINPWHFDFVICDIDSDFEPIAIIELDDSSHNNEFVIQRDNIKNEICNYINLPLLRTYGIESDEQIKQLLIEIL